MKDSNLRQFSGLNSLDSTKVALACAKVALRLRAICGSSMKTLRLGIDIYTSSPSLGRVDAEERGFGEGPGGFDDCLPARCRSLIPEPPPLHLRNEYSNRRCFAIAWSTASASCSTSSSPKRTTSHPSSRMIFSCATSCSPI